MGWKVKDNTHCFSCFFGRDGPSSMYLCPHLSNHNHADSELVFRLLYSDLIFTFFALPHYSHMGHSLSKVGKTVLNALVTNFPKSFYKIPFKQIFSSSIQTKLANQSPIKKQKKYPLENSKGRPAVQSLFFSRTWIISGPGPAVHSLVLSRVLIFLGARYIHG